MVRSSHNLTLFVRLRLEGDLAILMIVTGIYSPPTRFSRSRHRVAEKKYQVLIKNIIKWLCGSVPVVAKRKSRFRPPLNPERLFNWGGFVAENVISVL